MSQYRGVKANHISAIGLKQASAAPVLPRRKRDSYHHAEAWCFHPGYRPSSFAKTAAAAASPVNNAPSKKPPQRSATSEPAQ